MENNGLFHFMRNNILLQESGEDEELEDSESYE